MALVKFVSTDAAGFGGLTAKDENTLYFVSDERRIYKGAVPFSGGIYKKVSVLPSTTEAEVNVIYVVGDKGDTAAYYDGTQFVYINKPTSVAADLAALTERVTTAEGKLDTIQGTGEGSISKALSDANAHADTKVQELADGQVATNKSDIVGLKTTVAGKADKATTLAGYGITDAYTSGQVDTKITEAVANAHHLKRAIVEALPAVDAADADTIYMVKKATGVAGNGEGNVYAEYMLVNGKFEQIGDSAVDLTNYATKGEVSTAKQDAIDAAAADATTKADAAKTAAQKHADDAIAALDVTDSAVAGEYVSAVSETNGKITVSREKLPAAATLVEGTANGTVKFNGTDVAVHGLKSAAFVDTTAFDQAGAANGALTSAKTYADTKKSEAIREAKSYVEQLLTWNTI